MASRKFAVSRSLLARVIAISILIGMGTFAAMQNGKAKKAEPEVAVGPQSEPVETTESNDAGSETTKPTTPLNPGGAGGPGPSTSATPATPTSPTADSGARSPIVPASLRPASTSPSSSSASTTQASSLPANSPPPPTSQFRPSASLGAPTEASSRSAPALSGGSGGAFGASSSQNAASPNSSSPTSTSGSTPPPSAPSLAPSSLGAASARFGSGNSSVNPTSLPTTTEQPTTALPPSTSINASAVSTQSGPAAPALIGNRPTTPTPSTLSPGTAPASNSVPNSSPPTAPVSPATGASSTGPQSSSPIPATTTPPASSAFRSAGGGGFAANPEAGTGTGASRPLPGGPAPSTPSALSQNGSSSLPPASSPQPSVSPGAGTGFGISGSTTAPSPTTSRLSSALGAATSAIAQTPAVSSAAAEASSLATDAAAQLDGAANAVANELGRLGNAPLPAGATTPSTLPVPRGAFSGATPAPDSQSLAESATNRNAESPAGDITNSPSLSESSTNDAAPIRIGGGDDSSLGASPATSPRPFASPDASANASEIARPNSLQPAPSASGAIGSLAPAGLPAAGFRPSSQPADSSLSNSGSRSLQAGPSTDARPFPSANLPTEGSSIAVDAEMSDRTSAIPGDQQLEGEQSPSLVIQKSAPAEARLGEPAIFRITVKNVGDVPAQDVVVSDRIPQGASFRESTPAAARRGADGLTWALGDLMPGEVSEIRLTLVPERTGEIGSVAQVSFQARASARLRVTQPRLSMQLNGPEVAQVGDSIDVKLRLSNDGDGDATGVVIETDILPELTHPAGHELRYEVGSLPPGSSRDVTLTLVGISAAEIQQRFVAHGEGLDPVEKVLNLQLTAPKVALEVSGPSLRFLDRKAIHRLTVENRGTASAEDVELVASLPAGLKFLEADQQGTYDPRTHAVYWSLVELQAGQAGTVRMETIPEATGEFAIDYRVSAKRIEPQQQRQTMTVRQSADVTFEISDEIDHIEVDSETLYRISVQNQGSKDSRQIAIRLLFPEGIEPTDDVRSPVRFRRNGNEIVFETLERLAPEESFEIEIRAIGRQVGDHRIAVELATEERPDWVRKEESTHVYSDR